VAAICYAVVVELDSQPILRNDLKMIAFLNEFRASKEESISLFLCGDRSERRLFIG